jgi:hypothetical protein
MPTAFKNISPGATGPAIALKAITKSDTVDLPDGACRALLVGTAGTATVIDADGNTSVGVPLQIGYNPLSVTRIKTGGTADNIWALY